MLVAGLLQLGDHLVGHSYGGVISLLAAALGPSGSLADRDRAASDDGRAGTPRWTSFAEPVDCDASGANDDPEASCAGSCAPSAHDSTRPHRFRRICAGRAGAEVERVRGRPTSRFGALGARFPKLVVSGRTTRHSTRSATCSSAASRGARRAPGYGHIAQLHPASTSLATSSRRRLGAEPLARLGLVPLATANARVRELHDLEQVDDVDRERERDRARSRRRRSSPTDATRRPRGTG